MSQESENSRLVSGGVHDCYLIAEIGVNHNGDVTLGKDMIDAAAECGADAVKFQTFRAETLSTPQTPKVKYQRETTGERDSHCEMLKRLELSPDQHHELIAHCRKRDIEFISTPYSLDAVEFLKTLEVARYKVASADIVDLPMIRMIGETGKPVILSTGMATLAEIEEALTTLRDADASDVTLLHCVSNYPCSDESLNLRVIPMLRAAFQVPVGYSDHSVGVRAAALSVALGATVVERHFTLDKNLPGPDHRASSDPEEFLRLVRAVRSAEQMLGDPVKRCQAEEMEMAKTSRKSITLKTDLPTGTILKPEHLVLMRPGTGLYARFLQDVVGRRLREDRPRYHQLDWIDLE